MNVPILQPEQHWVCSKCTFTDVTRLTGVLTHMHSCAGLKGITAPMVEEGVNAKIEAIEREDYIGNDLPQYDGDGVPIMAVVTTRDDGQDCSVLAPTARIRNQMG